MKEKIEKYFANQKIINEMENEQFSLHNEIICSGISERALKFKNELHATEQAILKKLARYITCYNQLTLHSYDNITLESCNSKEFTIGLSYTDRENETFYQSITLPFDPSKDQEYLEEAKNKIITHWEEESAKEKKKDIEDKKNMLASLQKQLEEMEAQ